MLLEELVKLTQHHREACQPYRDYGQPVCGSKGERRARSSLPSGQVFKQFDLKSVSEQDVYKVMRSSGTSIFFTDLPRSQHGKEADPGADQCFADHFRRPVSDARDRQ